MHSMVIKLCVLLSLICFNSVKANDLQDHQQIVSTAHTYLNQAMADNEKDLSIQVNPPDPRLQLPRCSNDLESFSANGRVEPGANTVGIRCVGAQPWTIYLSATIQLFRPVAVLKTSLARGQELKPKHIQMKRLDVATLRNGYVTQPESVYGMIARRPMRVGHALNRSLLEAKDLVERGDQVDILAASANFQIVMKGVALDGGAEGDRISVRNVQSDRIVQATVIRTGVVEVGL